MGGSRSSPPPPPPRRRRPMIVIALIIASSLHHRDDNNRNYFRPRAVVHGFADVCTTRRTTTTARPIPLPSLRTTPSSSSMSSSSSASRDVVVVAPSSRVRASSSSSLDHRDPSGRVGDDDGEAVAVDDDVHRPPPSPSSLAAQTTTSPRGGKKKSLPTTLSAILLVLFFQPLLLFSSVLVPTIATASDYGSMSPEQRFVAEAWRTVDNAYIDRTFNGKDWFKMRQDGVTRKYDGMDEARAEVEGMLGSLGDRYTRYLSPAKYDSMVNAATGNLYGVGVELAPTKGNDNIRVMVSDVEPNGPAMRGGLRPGDVFVEADGIRFDDGKSTPDDVALVVRGPEGSKVGVVVERDGKTLDFILTREPIKITSVRGYVGEKPGVSGKVGVVRIKNFSGTTSESVRSEIDDLKKRGASNFVLDLRGNPGGLLPGGVDTASLFLEANRAVVYVVNKNGVVDAQTTLVDGFDLVSPLVILVDGNTASAAEVMTAALKENKRAVVAGERTFGKGIVQTVRQLEGGDNGGVAVTIARYETPDHHDINKQGIPVDVEANVDCAKEDALTCLPKEAFSFGKV